MNQTISSTDVASNRAVAVMRRAWLPLTVSGLLGIGLGAVVDPHRIVYGWFVAGVFYLSVCLGTTFLVIVHHLFDAVWMVTLRRFCEHAACLVFPWLAIVFFPLAVLPGCGGNAGGFGRVFRSDAGFGAGLHDRIEPLVSIGVLAVVFASWSWLAYKLRSLSLAQDNTGDPSLKCCLRRYSVGGAIVLAVTITAATGLWLRWVSPVWMSSIYAACFLTSCAWFAVAVIWLLAIAIGRAAAPGRIGGALQMRSIGAMLLAFTLLHGYMHYSQYFVVWNANLPAETWWYILRERGTWLYVGLAIVFGHLLVPFLVLLRASWRQKPGVVMALCVWAWPMHYLDIAFNVLPVWEPDGISLRGTLVDISCIAAIGGWLLRKFAEDLGKYPIYPVKDPQLPVALQQIKGGLRQQVAAQAHASPIDGFNQSHGSIVP